MSKTASPRLCKELYKRSGWRTQVMGLYQDCPVYDLSYLLQKLPRTITFNASELTLRLEVQWSGGWVAHYGLYDFKSSIADTPEDAVCKLAITLIDSGILSVEAKDGE